MIAAMGMMLREPVANTTPNLGDKIEVALLIDFSRTEFSRQNGSRHPAIADFKRALAKAPNLQSRKDAHRGAVIGGYGSGERCFSGLTRPARRTTGVSSKACRTWLATWRGKRVMG